MAAARVVSVHIGHIAPLGPDAVPSGFVKRPVAAAIQVTALGLVGDQQADLSVHGGPEKAVYGYSITHYSPPGHRRPIHTRGASDGSGRPHARERREELPEELNLDSTESPMCQTAPSAIVSRPESRPRALNVGTNPRSI
jgi:hypothetical protein